MGKGLNARRTFIFETINLNISNDGVRKTFYFKISSPKASNGQRFPCPALLSPWFSRGEAGQRGSNM